MSSNTKPTAQAYHQHADELRKVAYRARNSHEREAFQRLADGYDVLAAQLERIPRPDRPLTSGRTS
jgi:hypothetical protein